MTSIDEEEWNACDKVWLMAAALGHPGGRKFRLVLVAACRRRLWWPDPELLAALAAAEGFADGVVDADALLETEGGIDAAWARQLRPGGGMDGEVHDLLCLVEDAAQPDLEPWTETDWGYFPFFYITPDLVRDIWACPSRPVRLDSVRIPGDVRSLARVIYDERQLPSGHLDSAGLSILADALEEAGCADEAILSHLRSPGPHVRGCWALDLVLGRS